MTTAEAKSRTKSNYISGIDGLRAISVLMVLAYHLKLPIARGGARCHRIFRDIGIFNHTYFITGN